METESRQAQLIRQLLLEAGRIMEEGSPDLALSLPDDIASIRERISHLIRDAQCLCAIAAAADAILRQTEDPGDTS